MTLLADNLKNIHAENERKQYVKNWKDTLPEGSHWTPGSHGNPACKICEGRGWIRLDVPTWHPKFGKLQLCECVPLQIRQHLDFENSKGYRPTPKVSTE